MRTTRCGEREQYDIFDRMHYLCFHMEFEHDPDSDCGIAGCPVSTAPLQYLGELGVHLREQALEATAHARAHRDDAFAQGVAHAFYVTLSLMLSQAEAFQAVWPTTLGLDGLDPERDLL
ncbi:hypothetical protein [Paraconexibacter sp. AEG42_29]|uniref:hypothetical protein n=1 Tax=Paraconexibacter sp. AEG42_29 TaxID=2997339 RepID=UPI00339D83F7